MGYAADYTAATQTEYDALDEKDGTADGNIRLNNIGTGTGNTLTIGTKGGTSKITGKTVIAGKGENNVLQIYGGTFTFAEGSNGGNASGNEVTVSNATVRGQELRHGRGAVTGGYGGWDADIGAAQAENNAVTIDGGTIGASTDENAVVGGMVMLNVQTQSKAVVTGNKVTIEDGNIQNAVAGGMVTWGGNDYTTTDTSVSSNQVTINGGTVKKNVYGGYNRATSGGASNGFIRGNTVTVNAGRVNGIIYGGEDEFHDNVDGYYTVNKNEVHLTGGSVGSVYGGSGRGKVTNNKVILSDGAEARVSVVGGQGQGSAVVSGNSVEMSGGTAASSSSSYVAGGYGGSGEIKENSVILSGGSVAGSIYGGRGASGTVSENTVTISNGNANGNIYGGQGSGDTKNNTVEITGGTTSGKYIYGGIGNGEVSGNEVSLSDAQINSSVYGGYSSSSGTVTGNTVNISGDAKFKQYASIYGGYSGSGTVSDNTIKVSGNADNVSGSADLSMVYLYGANKKGSDNTLTLDGWTGTVRTLKNFDAIRFQNIDLSKKENTLLTIGSTDSSSASGSENADIYLDSVNAGGLALAAGDYGEGTETVLSTLKWDERLDGKVTVAEDFLDGAAAGGKTYFADRTSASDGVYANTFGNLSTTIGQNKVDIEAEVTNSVLAGTYVDADGKETYHSSGQKGLSIGDGFTTHVGTVAGTYAEAGQDAAGGALTITGQTEWSGNVYGGYAENGAAQNNTVTLKGANAEKLNVYGGASGSSGTVSGNTLVVSGGSSTVGSLHNFDTVRFDDVDLSQDTIALKGTADEDMADTNVEINSFSMESLAAVKNAQGGSHTTTISWDTTLGGSASFTDDFKQEAENASNGDIYRTADRAEGGVYAGKYTVTGSDADTSDHQAQIDVSVKEMVLTNRFLNEKGEEETNKAGTELALTNGFTTNVDTVAGVYAARTDGRTQNATKGTISISGATDYAGNVYGGYAENGDATGNTVTLKGASAENLNVYGGASASDGALSDNTLIVDGTSSAVGGLHNFDAVRFQNVTLKEGEQTVSLSAGSVSGMETADVSIGAVLADGQKLIGDGNHAAGDVLGKTTVQWGGALDKELTADAALTSSLSVLNGYYQANRGENGLYVNRVKAGYQAEKNQAVISAEVEQSILTGQFIDASGTSHVNGGEALVLEDGFTTKAGIVAGAYALGTNEVQGAVRIGGTIDWTGTVYAGYSEEGTASGTVEIADGTQAAGVSLSGGNRGANGSVLNVTGNGSRLAEVSGFDTINFSQVDVHDVAALSVGKENLADTVLNVKSFAADNDFDAGETVTLLHSDQTVAAGDVEDVELSRDLVLAGVAEEMQISAESANDGHDIQLHIEDVHRASQTDLIAENRAVAAAFVNQGADIAAESLHLLDDGYHWGTQTFGAVYGNRSQYDVNSDIKVNGWSEIVGVGNIHRVDGGRLAWGVFYENGTGNYRTWNEFNNEMFRGDGSLVYNGGGAAVRLTRDSGVYYEASLRMGNLSSSMTDAVRDGDGNSYGFDSDSTYWGAHIGAGKLIESGSGQWDIYGKYFHTDIDGESFVMGGDRFSFDSVTSDRLRIGARYMPATDAAWKVYYGAAYEYEFSGDSHMKAGRFDAPEQSLQGSTVFGEIGTVWGRKDSDWSVDVNLRGYAGEREGFSGMVQLAYAF